MKAPGRKRPRRRIRGWPQGPRGAVEKDVDSGNLRVGDIQGSEYPSTGLNFPICNLYASATPRADAALDERQGWRSWGGMRSPDLFQTSHNVGAFGAHSPGSTHSQKPWLVQSWLIFFLLLNYIL